ncbi:gliding motility-associated C-terminal domain-containing protein [Flavitalea sp. BT771]|uniref:gliding motility-associated C-terminal domain-containing protein n=1 Tax=Flavitalea sp. BT771 TaxID=3063329 RepID=UPI0026E22761|nr:gliding motility-associated C-terminal domain-containing protein [Flavitalea sp. BT771]MDO6431417.1 gliding motility-associated C-terminal domain-containing protein [Flavitalea sp. BT771]MDV6220325.1 gliding motility-associated C-terminal domain-containing protein [Flavitalea sp. BT771]
MKPQRFPIRACAAVLIPFLPYYGIGQGIRFHPSPGLIHTGDTTICAGKHVKLSATPLQDYYWSPINDLDSPASANPTATPSVTTTYYFTARFIGANLIVNGDFSNGNTGFTSRYDYEPVNRSEGQYFVGANPHRWNQSLAPCGDHTSGSGNMMMVNGSPDAGTSVWTQKVDVQPNTDFIFCSWIQSFTSSNVAVLQFFINGTPLGNAVTAGAACTWQQLQRTWHSDGSTVAIISLVNQNTLLWGNDFALDDISFIPITVLRDSVTIAVDSNPIVRAGKAHDIDCYHPTTGLNASGASTYTWYPAEGLSDTDAANPTVSIGNTTTYTVKGVNGDGCYGLDTVTVNVGVAGKDLFVLPNAFTPNGDGHNDYFGIQRWGKVEVEEFSIYSRAGVRVFTTHDPGKSWDGSFNGHPQPEGNYIYVIRTKTFCGPVTRTGNLTLIR